MQPVEKHNMNKTNLALILIPQAVAVLLNLLSSSIPSSV